MIGQLGHDHGLAAALRHSFAEQQRALGLQASDRARLRGEVPPHADLALLVDLVPAVVLYRVLLLGELPTPATVDAVVDHFLLPFACPPVGGAGVH